MKTKFTLSIAFLLTGYLTALSAGPTVPASTPKKTGIDGNRFTFTFNKGDGGSRIVVVREGSKITELPVNQVEYNANSVFGTVNTQFTNNNGYVVNKTIGGSSQTASVIVTNLKPATKYYISVFEYNGSGTTTEYLMLPLNDSVTTLGVPTSQTSNITFPDIAGNRVTMNWDKGNGDKRVILARKGAPVNAVPQDLTDYNHSTIFGSGAVINTDNFVVYDGAEATTPLTGLEPNTTYYFAAFECNGSVGPVYMKPGTTATVTTHGGPTQASGPISFSAVDGNSLTLSFAKGNGKYQLVIAREGQSVTATPENGHTYASDPAFKSGYEIAPGEFVVNSTGGDRVITNLKPSTEYYFRVYDYDVTNSGTTYYLTGSYSENHRSTAVPPTKPAKDAYFDNITGAGATIKYTAGEGGGNRLIIMKEGSPVDASPIDLTKYTGGSTVFHSGTQITPGNYLIGTFNGTAIGITGLTPGATYYAAVFEYSGNQGPLYAAAATAAVTIPNEPTAKATSFNPSSYEGNSFRCSWTGGNGSRHLVIARKGAPVTAKPTDGATYNANNNFMQGYLFGTDEYVVYDGEDRGFTLQNLEIATTYHLAIFEYNMAAGVPDYLTSSFFTANASTVSAPILQATVNSNNIQANQATITYAKGDGAGRLFIMRAGAPVNVIPQDLVNYSNTSTVFGAQEIVANSGNYLVYKTGGTSSFTVTNLAPGTEYYVAVFEYNGVSAPVFMKPGGTHHFTTAAGNTTPVPATASKNARFSTIDGNKLTFSWDAGDGTNRIIVMRAGSSVNFVPADGNAYPVSSTDLGNGQYIVYNSSGSGTTVSNLLPNTTYYFAVYEYNGSGSNTRYLTTALTMSESSASTPDAGVSGVLSSAANTTATISWVNGPGKGRLVIMKEGSAVTATPANLTKYNASPAFKGGVQVVADEYVVFAAGSNSVTVTDLDPLKRYFFRIFEFNGADAPVYNTVDFISGSVSASATLPLKWRYFTAKTGNDGVRLEWGTAEEKNTRYFVIERNTDNGFVALDTIRARNNTGNNDYTFTDPFSQGGRVIYRLQQVDNDGRAEYSKQVMVDIHNDKRELIIYPNPATSQCRISLPAGLTRATVQLYDTRGILVKTIQVTDKQVISLAGITPGVYYIILQGQQEKYSRQLIVQ